jgi:hypothetical protein
VIGLILVAVAILLVSGILRLTLLAPEMVEAILDGRQPAGLHLDDLLSGLPLDWEMQQSRLTGAVNVGASCL